MSDSGSSSDDRDSMPRPPSFDSPVQQSGNGEMPVPTMGETPETGEMPRPAADDAFSPARAVPDGTGDDASANGGMPAPRTPAGAGPATGRQPLPRFGPPGGAGTGGAALRPGVVEVQFRADVAPTVTQEGATPAVATVAGGVLDTMNQILQRHGLRQAEPTFETSREEAVAAQSVAAAQGIDVPLLAQFMTLHFAPDADTRRIAEELRGLPEVEAAVAVPIALPPTMVAGPRPGDVEVVAAAPAPTDPLVGTSSQIVVDPATGLQNQWYLRRCQVPQAWPRSTGRNVVITDVDWGYRTSHEDLAAKIKRTYNSYDGTSDVTHGDSVFHGTGVAGLAGAAANGRGMVGVAYDAEIWAVQADSGTGAYIGGEPWARGIDWVRRTDSRGRRKVVILEVQTGAYGNYEQVPSVNAAIRTAIAAGVVVCVAAGNGDRDAGVDDLGGNIPATGSILVGATAYHPTENRRASFSNYGPRIVVSAPGDGGHDVTCDDSGDTAYRNEFGGTSGATPKVAGAAAMMLAANPALSPAEVRHMLRVTGATLTPDPGKALGTFLDAGAAVRQAAVGATGRLEVFARGADGALWHKWQTAPNGSWSGWKSEGAWCDLIDVGRNADGRLEVFVRGSDAAVWQKWQTTPNGTWSAWKRLGGWVDLLSVGRNADGRLEVFARGADKAVWHVWQVAPNGTWSAWKRMGGWVDLLTVAQNADGRLEVFARGADQALWHISQVTPNGSWSPWTSLGGWIDRLSVGRNDDGRLEVFVRGADGALWHRWQTALGGTWSGWKSEGGWFDLIDVGKNADGRLEVFTRGVDKALWHIWQVAPNGTWGAWATRGGWLDLLDVDQNNDGRLEVFSRGVDKALWRIGQVAPNGTWGAWTSEGGWIDRLDVGQNAL